LLSRVLLSRNKLILQDFLSWIFQAQTKKKVKSIPKLMIILKLL